MDERAAPVTDAIVWAQERFREFEPLFPTRRGAYRWQGESMSSLESVTAGHEDGRQCTSFETDGDRLLLHLGSPQPFEVKLTDASGAPVAGATVVHEAKAVGQTGPDGTWSSLRFGRGLESPT